MRTIVDHSLNTGQDLFPRWSPDGTRLVFWRNRERQVEVTLARDDGHLAVSVRDDGCGFDPTGPRGLGLTGLTDRLDTLGGSLAVESGRGAGTVLRMRIPVPATIGLRDG